MLDERVGGLGGDAAHVLVPDHPHVALLTPRVAPGILDDPIVKTFLVTIADYLQWERGKLINWCNTFSPLRFSRNSIRPMKRILLLRLFFSVIKGCSCNIIATLKDSYEQY